ncbi:polyketide synthase [Astrocystis sublimbata]|nr:polyketide synthase [Astrocystis sublimbata]
MAAVTLSEDGSRVDQAMDSNVADAIAIVGMGCRLPGNVHDESGLWDLLVNKRTGYRDFGDHRFALQGFYHPEPGHPGSMLTRGGFLLAEDPRLFDPSFFHISPSEVDTMDPSQRKLLEVVYEAFENSGEPWHLFSGSRTGVFVGNFSTDHTCMVARDPDNFRPYAATGSSGSILSNRINHVFNLLGPSMTMDTACSSSMYSLHVAAAAIRNGDCESAIVAASNCIMDPAQQLMMEGLGVLSASSTCHTFDAAADGYARGEGFAALYLRKLSDAIAGNYPIRAVIRGTAINSNGRTAGITHPSGQGQEAVIRRAYDSAGLAPADTTFFECHGTGTPVGDPIEISAISNVFSPEKSHANPLLIGSVKTNLGHTEASSAIVGVMKVVLALERGFIPPSVGFTTPNPKIDYQKANVVVVKDVIRWPKGQLRRASVNSFGYGGANGHCIRGNETLPRPLNGLKASRQNGHARETNGYPSRVTMPSSKSAFVDSCEDGKGHSSGHSRLPVSRVNYSQKADSVTRRLVAMELNIAALAEVINDRCLSDTVYTLAARRTRFNHRTYCIVANGNPRQGLMESIDHLPHFLAASNVPKLGFVFTGQGAQWHSMGASLLQYTIFGDCIRHMDRILATLSNPPPWKIADIISGACNPERVHEPQIAQATCTAIQIALVDLLASWGVRPAIVIGHSSGEMAAAYASGRVSLTEAILAAFVRGQVISGTVATDGAMLAVGLGPDEILPYITEMQDSVQIAAVNSTAITTLSGDKEKIEILGVRFNEIGIFNRTIKTSGVAYHSHHMRKVGDRFEAMLLGELDHVAKLGLADRRYTDQQVCWVSSVHPAKKMVDRTITANYWRLNLENPVQFLDAVQGAIEQAESGEIQAFVELGPHPALKGPLNHIFKTYGTNISYVPSLKRGEDSQRSMLHLAGKLYCLNAPINMALVNFIDEIDGEGDLTLVHGCTSSELPPYQHLYGPIQYYENRPSREYRTRKFTKHELVGSKVPGNAKLKPQWRNILRLKNLPWLDGHRVMSDMIFPAACYVSMAIEVASQTSLEFETTRVARGFSLRNVQFYSMLRVPEDDFGVEVITTLDLYNGSWMGFTISSVVKDSDKWSEHCSGLIRVETDERPAEAFHIAMDARTVSPQACYKMFAGVGLKYGPAFQGLRSIQTDPARGLAVAEVALDATGDTGRPSEYAMHLGSLDSTFQLALVACYGGDSFHSAYLPTRIDEMYLKSHIPDRSRRVTAQGELRGLRGAYATLRMHNDASDILMSINQLCYTRHEYSLSRINRKQGGPVTRLTWKPDVRTMTSAQAAVLFPPPSKNQSSTHLFEVFDRLGTIIVAEIFDRYDSADGLQFVSKDIDHFLAWVRRRMTDETPYVIEAKGLSSSMRQARLAEIFQEADCYAEVRAAQLVYQNIDDIVRGIRSSLDVVVQGGLRSSLYEEGILMTGAYSQVEKLFESIAFVEPNLRILEVGAGTGGATRVILKVLAYDSLVKGYAQYTFTDVSSAFLSTARDSLSGFLDMDFAVLDIEEDPLGQGFEPVYDVIVASQCLHVTSDILNTLANCRKLLKPGGRLVLIENIRTLVGHGLVLGTLPGYWNGISDGRLDSPFLSLDGWDMSLRATGFSGTDIVLHDHSAPYSTTCTTMSSALCLDRTPVGKDEEAIHLVYVQEESDMLFSIASEFERRKMQVQVSQLSACHVLPLNSHVVAILDQGTPLLSDDEAFFSAFQDIIPKVSMMMCVTHCGMLQGRNPSAGVLTGLLRTLGAENPTTKFQLIDIDPDSDLMDPQIPVLIADQSMALLRDNNVTAREREYAWQQGCLWYYENISNPADQIGMVPFGREEPIRAEFETPGILTSLYFKPNEDLCMPGLGSDWIQVKVFAMGLNWKDLAVTSGRLDKHQYSSEFSGIVDKVGPAAMAISPGDRVYGLAKGHFGNYVRTSEALVQKVRPTDDLAEMATMSVVFATSIYAFEHVSKLKAGDKVLIQTATGGLGLSAIQIARLKGAEIYATAGTPDKIRHLVEVEGLPQNRVFSSRDIVGLSQNFQNWFDVILGTATGDMLRESVKLLSPLGIYIDVGRVDVQNSKTISLEIFQKCATFSSFDLGDVVDANPVIGRALMESVQTYYQKGFITPIRPMSSSDISALGESLLAFSKGTHLGKLIVTFQQPDTLVRGVLPIPRVTFHHDACYMVTGGLGGLGRSIVRWMARRGARQFLILSRSGASAPEAQLLVSDLETMGCTIHVVRCNISAANEVEAIVAKYTQTYQIKGIIHAAVSLHDLSFNKLDFSQWRLGLEAKVQGTMNIHEATKGLALDFFTMITSLVSIVAPATQSAYTAANSFQEAFARHRRRLGLKASTLSCGLVTDIGPLSTDATRALMVRNQVLGMTEKEFLRLLELSILNDITPNRSDNGTGNWFGALDDTLSSANIITCLDPRGMADQRRHGEDDGHGGSKFVPRWYTDPRVSHIMRAVEDIARQKQDGTIDSHPGRKVFVETRQIFEDLIAKGVNTRSEAEAMVTTAIVETVAKMLFVDVTEVDPGHPVAHYGIDSLIAAELRNWVFKSFGVDISMLGKMITTSALEGREMNKEGDA